MILFSIVRILFLFLFFVNKEKHDSTAPVHFFYVSSGHRDISDRLEQILKDPGINTIVFRDSGIVVDKVINIPRNKTIRFEPGACITGKGTLNGGIIQASYHQQLFGGDLKVNPQEKDSVFSVKWYGAKGDGISNDRESIRLTFDMTKRIGGGNVFLPKGTYVVSRRDKAPFSIIDVYSNTKVSGEGMDKTVVKLDPNDMKNFRRIFFIGSKSEITENVEVSDMTIDMENPFKTYPPPASFGHDAQSAAIICYSDSFDVRNVHIHDLVVQNVPGDVIIVSTNSKNITIERIYQKNYLRQGISIGGTKGVDSITVRHIYDLPFTNGVVKYGNSIRTEPYAVVKNVSYTFSDILDFSASGIDGLLIDSVVTRSGSVNTCHDVSNFLIRNNVLNSKLQIAPVGPGVVEKNELKKGILVTSVGKGGFRDMSGIVIRKNYIIDTSSAFTNVRVTQVNGVGVYDNTIKVNADAIVFSNAKSGKVMNNRIWVNNPSYYAVHVYSTIKDRYGEGPYEIDGNIVYGANKGIKGHFVTSDIGLKNIVNK